MGRRGIKRKAEELLGLGCSKQQTFDTLVLEHPEVKPKKVADVVRHLPTWLSRERYRNLHRTLLALAVVNVVLRVAQPLLAPDFEWVVSYRLILLAPIATLLVGWSLYRWQGEVFGWIGWANVLSGMSLIGHVRHAFAGNVHPWSLAFDALAIAIGGIAIFLSNRVFAKYREEKDPAGIAPPRYVFPAEPGMQVM